MSITGLTTTVLKLYEQLFTIRLVAKMARHFRCTLMPARVTPRSRADDAYTSQPYTRIVPVTHDYIMEGNHMSSDFIPSWYTRDVFEYEKQGTNISVVHWRQIGCAPYILDVLEHGYVIPLQNRVEPSFLHNNKSSREEPVFVQKAIDELLESALLRPLHGLVR